MKIGRMEAGDIGAVVELYTAHMPESTFARLGWPFLTALYRALVCAEHAVSLVAREEGRVVGFITAADDAGRLNRLLLRRHALAIGWSLFRGLLLRPTLLPPLLQTFSYSKREGAPDIAAELLWIAIEPGHRDGRLGDELIRCVLEELHRRGVRRVKVSILAGNEPVRRVLARLAFKPHNRFSFFGKEMILMTTSVTTDQFPRGSGQAEGTPAP